MNNTIHPLIVTACVALVFTSCKKRQEDNGASGADHAKSNMTPSTDQSVPDPSLLLNTFDDPADGYFQAYLLIRESEKSENKQESIQLLEQALGYFDAIKSQFPHWKSSMVDARTKHTQKALATLSENGR